MLSATQQQGGGLVNVLKAITARSQVSPGEILASDVSKTLYGAANVTITNKSLKTKSYTFSHQGAGYMNELLQYREIAQQPNYGAAQFSPSSVKVAPGKTVQVAVKIIPPTDVDPGNRPVFGGYIQGERLWLIQPAIVMFWAFQTETPGKTEVTLEMLQMRLSCSSAMLSR